MNILIAILLGIFPIPTEFESEIFAYANEERIEALEQDKCLIEVARKKSKDMYDREYFAHKDPETGKIETWGWIREACGGYTYAGENLTMNFTDAEKAHKALMNSPSHRKNIVNPNFEKMGVGCYKHFCTQLFR